jgi:hypothetical protein
MLLDGALWEDIAINFQVLTQYGTSFDFFLFCSKIVYKLARINSIQEE